MAIGETPYEFESTSGCSIITLHSPLNDVQWADIDRVGNECLKRLEAEKHPALLVDISSLNYMGSAMVALIVKLWKAVKQQGGSMAIVNRDENVLEVLRLAGLLEHWKVVDTREQGLEELGVKGHSASGGNGGTQVKLLLAAGILVVIGGVVGLLNPADSLNAAVRMGVLFGCTATGLVLGTLLTVLSRGGSKAIGGVIVVTSLILMIAGVVQLTGSATATG